MKRIPLGDGKWFNPSTAKQYQEDTHHDGRNHISVNTGTQWDHQSLYRTKGGTYVLCEWSDWQGSIERYGIMDEKSADDWLVANGHKDGKGEEV